MTDKKTVEILRWLHDNDFVSQFMKSEVQQATEKAIQMIESIENIRTEIADLDDAEYEFEGYYKAVNDALQIIDKYANGGMSQEVKEHYEKLGAYYNTRGESK